MIQRYVVATGWSILFILPDIKKPEVIEQKQYLTIACRFQITLGRQIQLINSSIGLEHHHKF